MKLILALLLPILPFFCESAPAAESEAPAPRPAPTPERITSFDVDFTVNPDATVTVVERIQVAVRGEQIKRGIVRIIPLDHKTADGGTHRTDITLLSTTLDGNPVPNATQRSGGNISLVLGDVDVLLTHGIHTYEIRYAASGHVRFLQDRDAIYWNVTGNFWELAIDEASCRVHLPEGAEVVAANAYTGKTDEAGSDFTTDGDLFFVTSRPLAIGEGLTVAVDWTKGVVQPPPPPSPVTASEPRPRDPPTDWEKWVHENRGLSLWGFVAVALGYFIPARLLFGPRRRKDTVIPLFHPPEGMDPGAMAALKRGSAGPECFAADVMQLAVKGHLRVSSFLTGFTLTETTPEPGNAKGEISSALSALKGNLFAGGKKNDAGETSVNTGRDRGIIAGAYNRLQERYKDYIEYMFDRNRTISIFGMVIFCMYTLAVVGARTYFAEGSRAAALENVAMWGTLFLCGGVYAGYFYLRLTGGGGVDVRLLIGLGVSVFGLLKLLECIETEYIAMFLLGAGVTVVFCFFLMPRRTRECDRLMTEIDGLEMYVGTAEKERLAILNAPEDTVEQYERLLPYAIALGCAEAWESRFASVLEHAGYRPAWAEGEGGRRGFYPRELARGGAEASRAAAAAIREAKLADRSASKSGGWWSGGSGSSGGRSGGGSGGGGGGGW